MKFVVHHEIRNPWSRKRTEIHGDFIFLTRKHFIRSLVSFLRTESERETFSRVSRSVLEPFQTSKMKRFAEIVFTKRSILVV